MGSASGGGLVYTGSCTSAKFVIDTIKADRTEHYVDQEIRIPPPRGSETRRKVGKEVGSCGEYPRSAVTALRVYSRS